MNHRLPSRFEQRGVPADRFDCTPWTSPGFLLRNKTAMKRQGASLGSEDLAQTGTTPMDSEQAAKPYADFLPS